MTFSRASRTVAVVAALAAASCNHASGNGPSPDAAPPSDAAPSPDATSPDAGPDLACGWSQWGHGADHQGQTCVAAQPPTRLLKHLVYDPFQTQEIAAGAGALFVHYQVPLNDNADNFYMMQKAGTYVSCSTAPVDTPCDMDRENILGEIWTENKYHRAATGEFELVWSFESDWKPASSGLFEPMFQPALAGTMLYVPGAGGSIWQVLTTSDHAQPIQRINPFSSIDPNTFVSGGITIDRQGFLYWNVIQQDPVTNAAHGFLIKASPAGEISKVDYETLIPGAPGADDDCVRTFAAASPRPAKPWPPSADAVPPSLPCGRQRPGINVTPAIGPDGTVFTASRADFASGYSYVVALKPDLSLKWATSLRGLVNDGCGVHHTDYPDDDAVCSGTFSAIGVDPATNQPPALTVEDSSSSTPVALPDGGVVYGAQDNYNRSRGHLVKLGPSGEPAGTYTFGWDTTPALYLHDSTYSIVLKDNHYGGGGPFFITQLSKDLVPEWRFQDTTTQACVRQPDGTSLCSDEPHPNGFEWCVNAPAVDANGDVFANSEDGNVYQIGQGGVLKTQTFLNQALGAAYTPIALDPSGRVYALNNGELSVLGR